MDQFQHNSDAVSNPARSALAVTADDLVPFPALPKALFIGTGGDVRLLAADDDMPVIFANLPSGAILPVRAKQVFQSGTSAAQIVALY